MQCSFLFFLLRTCLLVYRILSFRTQLFVNCPVEDAHILRGSSGCNAIYIMVGSLRSSSGHIILRNTTFGLKKATNQLINTMPMSTFMVECATKLTSSIK